MTELEELRAENQMLRAKLAAVRAVPELPAEHEGEAIEWRRWEPAPFILCAKSGDLNGCAQCDHPGPSLLTFGEVETDRGPRVRFQASRCPGCQETRVYRRDRDWRGLELVEIAYHPTRASYQP